MSAQRRGHQAHKPPVKPAKTAAKPTPKKIALPPLGSASPLNLPAIVEKTLPNGLKIVLLEDHTQPAVWMRLAIPAGAIRDPQEKAGLAEMVANLLEKGTTTRTEAQIAEAVDNLGASLSAFANEDHLFIAARGLSAHTDTLFELLADVTLHPTFPQEELDRARTRALSGIQFALSQPGTLADAALNRLVYGAHPYGNPSNGTPRSLPDIKREDLQQSHNAYFAPNAATLFLVGDITPEQAMQKAEAAFGAWERKEVAPLPAPPSKPAVAHTDTPQITILDRPGAAQTEIRIGALTSGYNTPERVIGTVASAVLGLGQFEGRLTKEIRVKRGLTYGAGSAFSRNAQAGDFQISTFTKNESTAEVIKIALAEAQKLCRELTPADELQDRKSFLLGSFAVGVATPPDLLERLVPAVLNGGGPEDLAKFTERVQAVTPRQIQEVINNLNLRQPQIVLVGDAKAIEKDARALGNVTVIPSDAVDLLSPTLKEIPKAVPKETPKEIPKATPEQVAEGQKRLAATIKAHGGDAFLNVKFVMMKGKGELSPPGQQIKLPVNNVTLNAAAPDKSRLDLKMSFGDIIFASVGKTGWVRTPRGVQDAPPGVSGVNDPADLLRQAVQKKYAVRSLPDTENGKPYVSADGKPLIGFVLTDEKGQESSVFVEKETHRLRRIVGKGLQGEVLILAADYHETEGVQLPGKIELLQNGAPFLSLVFDTFSVNKPVDSGFFVRPRN